MSLVPVIDEDADVGYWRARAGRAEARVVELEAATAALRADKAGLNARVAELAGQVDRLQESVTTLSGLLFGSSSEKHGSSSRGNGRDAGADGGDRGGDGGVRPGGRRKRGQRPGGRGHGRRDHSQLETEERFIDVDASQRCCAECGEPFEFLGTEDSEQIDWQVKIWSPGIFVDISIMLLLVPNCQIGARNPLGLSCRADVVSGRDCNIARCSRTRRS